MTLVINTAANVCKGKEEGLGNANKGDKGRRVNFGSHFANVLYG